MRQARVVSIVVKLWGWMVQSMNPTRGQRFVSPPKPLDQLWRPCSLLVGTRVLCTEVIWPGCEADHSPSSNTEFKKEWTYTFTPPVMPLRCGQGHLYLFFCLFGGFTIKNGMSRVLFTYFLVVLDITLLKLMVKDTAYNVICQKIN
jgi:hypothetical protein